MRLVAGMLACAASLALTTSALAAPATRYWECSTAGPTSAPTGMLNDVPVAGSWTATAPATNFQDGGGCTFLDTGFQGQEPGNTVYDTVLVGSYAGEVRKIDLNLYELTMGNPYGTVLIPEKHIDVIVQVDGDTVATVADLKSARTPGSLQSSESLTYTIRDLDIPASPQAKDFTLTVRTHYSDDWSIWAFGAKDLASSAKLYAFNDLTPEEQDEILGVEGEE